MKVKYFKSGVIANIILVSLLILNISGTATANTTPQTLPFTQNWSTNIITTANDWSGIPGIMGYQGIDLTTIINFDARSMVVPDPETAPQVFANTTPTNASGGVAEMDTEANPTIALQGSGTGDASHIVIYLNTTGQNGIRVQYNARDIDGTADNAVQQIVTQYRVGTSGNFITIPGGYIADASSGPSQATQVTPIDVVLPVAANNQPLVQVRIMTINATGSDEWIGIDDINITGGAQQARKTSTIDFNGDGRSDHATLLEGPSLGSGQLTWLWTTDRAATFTRVDFGRGGDVWVPADYDGDGRDDIAVFRNDGTFYIINSSNNTLRIESFGITNDNAKVVGDYSGDGKADIAVYRQGTWFYRTVQNGPTFYNTWGTTGDFATPGDFDGDGKMDFAIARVESGSFRHWRLLSGGGVDASTLFGSPGDRMVRGDFDGDGKTDTVAVRTVSGAFVWYIRPSSGAADQVVTWGDNGSGDLEAPADYDGDGRTDAAVQRFTTGAFWTLNTASNISSTPTFAPVSSYPAARVNVYNQVP